MADLTRCLCIVSRDRLFGRDFLAAVQTSVRPEDQLEIVVDRRRGEPSSQWQGAEDRRKRPHVDLALKKNGVAIVPAAFPGDERRPEPSLRDQTSGQVFEGRLFARETPQREIPQRESPHREIPQNERSVKAERGSQPPLGVQSWLDSRVTTASEDFKDDPYVDHDDDDAERLESILSFKRERSRRMLLPWIIAVLAVAAAAAVILFPLAHSLKQSAAPRAVSEVPSSATDRLAGGEPSSLSSRGDASAEPSRDNREPAAESSAPPLPQATTGTAVGRRAKASDDASAASARDNREPAAESSAPPAPQTATGTTAGRRAKASVNEPAPRQTASAPPRSEPMTPPRSEPMSRLTSPRFAGVPSVDVSREPGSPPGMYSARILDPAGRPLSDADVLLLARMSDGTVENVRMQFSPDRGTYHGALPPTRSSLVDLRVRVITGDKRIEIPVGP